MNEWVSCCWICFLAFLNEGQMGKTGALVQLSVWEMNRVTSSLGILEIGHCNPPEVPGISRMHHSLFISFTALESTPFQPTAVTIRSYHPPIVSTWCVAIIGGGQIKSQINFYVKYCLKFSGNRCQTTRRHLKSKDQVTWSWSSSTCYKLIVKMLFKNK